MMSTLLDHQKYIAVPGVLFINFRFENAIQNLFGAPVSPSKHRSTSLNAIASRHRFINVRYSSPSTRVSGAGNNPPNSKSPSPGHANLANASSFAAFSPSPLFAHRSNRFNTSDAKNVNTTSNLSAPHRTSNFLNNTFARNAFNASSMASSVPVIGTMGTPHACFIPASVPSHAIDNLYTISVQTTTTTSDDDRDECTQRFDNHYYTHNFCHQTHLPRGRPINRR
jgi:hypothetical protein